MAHNTETVGHASAPAQTENGIPLQRADHAMGVELQIVELVEQQTRARVQDRMADAERFDPAIAQLRAELAATADLIDPGEFGPFVQY